MGEENEEEAGMAVDSEVGMWKGENDGGVDGGENRCWSESVVRDAEGEE